MFNTLKIIPRNSIMSHEQNDNTKLSDKSTVNQFESAASKAGTLMRDEVYGSGAGHTTGDGHNHSGSLQNFAVSGSSDGHNHGVNDQNVAGSLDKLNQILPISDGHAHGQVAQNASASLEKPATPIGLDRSALSGMLQNGALTYQQAIAMGSPELASYLASFRVSKPSA
jgi:hypothetical protein